MSVLRNTLGLLAYCNPFATRRPKYATPVGDVDRLDALPRELQMMIAGYLLPADKLRLSRTSKKYVQFIDDAFFGNVMQRYPGKVLLPRAPGMTHFEYFRPHANRDKKRAIETAKEIQRATPPRLHHPRAIAVLGPMHAGPSRTLVREHKLACAAVLLATGKNLLATR